MSKANDKWLMRNEAGRIFGPVPLATLIDWANDNRIAPTFKISSDDGVSWIQSAEVSELGMKWFADVAPGNTYGPVPKAAIESLIKEGAIPSNVKIYCVSEEKTKDRRPPDDEKKNTGKPNPPQPYADTESLKKRIAALELEKKTITEAKANSDSALMLVKRDVEQLKLRNNELKSRVSEHEELLRTTKEAFERISSLNQEHENTIQRQNDIIASKERELSDLHKNFKLAEAKIAETAEVNRALEEKIVELKEFSSSQTAEIHQLQNDNAVLKTQLIKKGELLQSQQDDFSKQNALLLKRIDVAESNARNTSSLLLSANEKIKSLNEKVSTVQDALALREKRCLELEQSLSEMEQRILESSAETHDDIEFTDFEILEPETVENPPPDRAQETSSASSANEQSPQGGTGNWNTLAALEAQARRELAAINAEGGLSSLFGRK